MKYWAHIGAIGVLLSSVPAWAGSPGWSVSEFSGDVTVERAGATYKLQQRGGLKAGDVLKTGEKSRAVLTRGAEYMVVSANSHIEIAAPEQQNAVTQVIEYFGNVLFNIEKKSTPHFGVGTPYMAAVVKGTTFSVTVSEEGASVQVTEGAVEISPNDSDIRELITPGVIGAVEGANPLSMTIIENGRSRVRSPVGAAAESGARSRVAGTSETRVPAGRAVTPAARSAPIDLGPATDGFVTGFAGAEGENPGIGGADGPSDALAEAKGLGGAERAMNAFENAVGSRDNDEAGPGDGNNGHGNDPDGEDGGNPGKGPGKGPDKSPGKGPGQSGGGNNGHGNDPDGEDGDSPGKGAGKFPGKLPGKGGDGNNGHGNDPDGEDDSNPGKGRRP